MECKQYLKIKDDIDLKILEQSGYRYIEYYSAYVKEIDTAIHTIYIYIFTKNQNYKYGKIVGDSSLDIDFIFDIDRMKYFCKDLIENDFVEEVNEDEHK